MKRNKKKNHVIKISFSDFFSDQTVKESNLPQQSLHLGVRSSDDILDKAWI